jgi:hypothetical protein
MAARPRLCKRPRNIEIAQNFEAAADMLALSPAQDHGAREEVCVPAIVFSHTEERR